MDEIDDILRSPNFSELVDYFNHFQNNENLFSDPIISPNPEQLHTSSEEIGDDDEHDGKHCLVCGDIAGKHIYYGGISCGSCRAFFRRAVRNDSYHNYECSTGLKNCKITVETRKNCQYCRFYKCSQRAGMRIPWVLPKTGKRNSSSNKINVNKTRRELGSNISSFKLSPNISTPVMSLTKEEINFIGYLNNEIMANSLKGIDVFIHDKMQFVNDLAYYVDRGYKFSDSFCKDFNLMCLTSVHYITYFLSEIQELSGTVARVLFDENVPIMKQFKCSVVMEGEFYPLTWLSQKYGLSSSSSSSSSSSVQNRPVVYYHQIYVSPWAETLEDEELHQSLVQKMWRWPRMLNVEDEAARTKSSNGELEEEDDEQDPVMVLLMQIIMFFNPLDILPDRGLSKEDREKINQIQLKFSLLLHRYLRYRYGSKDSNIPNKKLGQGFMNLSYAREVHDIAYNKSLIFT